MYQTEKEMQREEDAKKERCKEKDAKKDVERVSKSSALSSVTFWIKFTFEFKLLMNKNLKKN